MRSSTKTWVGLAVAVLALGAFSNKAVLADGTGVDCGCMDVWLVIDDTGSMFGAIANVKSGLGTIIATAQAASGGDLRMGVITFKDTITVNQDLTANIVDVQNAVNAIGAGGGAGKAESSAEAIRKAMSDTTVGAPANSCTGKVTGTASSFRPACVKIIVMVTDAPPGGCNDIYTDADDGINALNVANEALAAGVKISAIRVDNGQGTSALHPTGIESEIMSDYATITGGVFATVPGDGLGTDTAITAIVKDCGGGGGEPVPTVSEWGLIATALLLLVGAKVYFSRRRVAETL